MKKLIAFIFSQALLLSSASLMAQASYSFDGTPNNYVPPKETVAPAPVAVPPAPPAPPAPPIPPTPPAQNQVMPKKPYADKNNQMPSNRINWAKNYSDAVSQSQTTSKPIIILFTGTNWCPACMKLEREVLTQPGFAQQLSQKFVFLKAEFPDYSENAVMASPFKPLLDRYNIDAFPTMVIVNSNGQRLYTVNYREGGAQMYVRELLQFLNQSNGAMMPSYQ